MGSENSKRSFDTYDYYLKDIRVVAIKEDDPEEFSYEFNNAMDAIEEAGYMVVGISTIIDGSSFNTVIDYVPKECVYWKGGECDGRGEQIPSEADNSKEVEGREGQEE